MKIDILYADEELMVVNKPSGIVVNRAQSVREKTVQDWVDEEMHKTQKLQAGLFAHYDPTVEAWKKRSGIVHRLDKATSGVLLIANNPHSFYCLQQQFQDRKIEKEYTALVHGQVVAKKGVIKAPVGRTPWAREKFGVLPTGKKSTTTYEVQDYYLRREQVKGNDSKEETFSLLSLHPITGRTHQIRVHLQYLGYPIVADKKYAGRKRYREDIRWCPRLFLHARQIAFMQPTTKEKIVVESQLPSALLQAMAKLRRD